MKLQVEMNYSAKVPMFVTELDVASNNLMEAKFQAVDIAKKIAWYSGYKKEPKSINVYSIK
jgi:hypothetical protein